MGDFVNKVVATAPGKAAFKVVRPFIHLSRRILHPGVPSDHKITTVSYGGKTFSVFHRRTFQDICVIQQSFDERQYDMPNREHGRHIQRIYQQIVDSGRQPLIIDCGSNIGASVLWFNARYPKAHIVAIEPAPDNLVILKRNIAGLDVDLIEGGISGSDGSARLLPTGGGSYAYQTVRFGDGVEIKMVSISTILSIKPESRYVPFILKIDIEGSEHSLFSGDTSAFNRFPLILMEPHDWMLPGQLSSLPFFRFHTDAGREFAFKNEIIASIDVHGMATPAHENSVVAAAAAH
jgi:FkbM family methyltransferase